MVDFDVRAADAAYKPIPPFDDWRGLAIDAERYERYVGQLASVKTADPQLLSKALELVRRAAAVETGAIEGLYEVERGFTFTVAAQLSMWEAELERQGPVIRALIQSQLEVYEQLLDLATTAYPVTEAAVRRLHEELCRNQDTYTAYTEIGRQEIPLPKGRYKSLPNHVRKQDGSIHSYAPVEETPAEMHRLVEAIRSDGFLQAHPVLQAAYAHYALVAIHPFADGNGRVARALASIFTYRAHDAPVLIFAENRDAYFSTLETADAGRYQPFVEFITERCIDAIRLVHDSFRTAKHRPVDESLRTLQSVFTTSGGYEHEQVDRAGAALMELFAAELRQVRVTGAATIRVENTPDRPYEPREGFRKPVAAGPRAVRVILISSPPAREQVERHFAVEVPQDCGKHDDFAVRNLANDELYEARASELIPRPTTALQFRIRLWVDGIVSDALQELERRTFEALKRRGY